MRHGDPAADLASMMATLSVYDSLFGPHHPQTLCLGLEVALAQWRAGQAGQARSLLKRVLRDIDAHLSGHHQLQLRAAAALRDLLVEQRDHAAAVAIQQEIVERLTHQYGPGGAEAAAARHGLAALLLAAPFVSGSVS